MFKLKDLLIILVPPCLIFVLFIYPLLVPGLIVGSDWSFPSTRLQLQTFFYEGLDLWSSREIPTGYQVPHDNIYLFQILAGLFARFGSDGAVFQRILVAIIVMGMYVSSLILFIKITHQTVPSVLGASTYVFSPIVFNYLNMGWLFVLLFMALSPLFILLGASYLKRGGFFPLLGQGVIVAIGFLQSQSIIWFPILFVVCALCLLSKTNYKLLISRLICGLIFIFVATFIVHMVWILPLSLNPEPYVYSSTSSGDVVRFSSITNLTNLLRGWGSLFNEQFETSFEKQLQFSSYVFVVMLVVLLGFSNIRVGRYIMMAAILVLLPMVFFLSRGYVATLPLSNIVRDTSRFIVFSCLGFALVTCLFFSSISGKFTKIIFIALIVLSIHPYLLGRLFNPRRMISGASEFGKDQRIRFLNVSGQDEILKSHETGKSIFFPYGGSVTLPGNEKFDGMWSAISDVDAEFSPNGGGIFISDKSDQVILDFVRLYSYLAVNNVSSLFRLSRLYGISNILLREGMRSSYFSKVSYDLFSSHCMRLKENGDPLSVTSVCAIDNTYPLFYSSAHPISKDGRTIGQFLNSDFDNARVPLAVIDCSEQIGTKESISCATDLKGVVGESDVIKTYFNKTEKDRYVVEVDKGSYRGPYLLVLNQTFHRGWVIEDGNNDDELNYKKMKVNDLVSGWIVPSGGKARDVFVVKFAPQGLFDKLLPISLLSIIISSALLLFRFFLYLINNSNKKNNHKGPVVKVSIFNSVRLTSLNLLSLRRKLFASVVSLRKGMFVVGLVISGMLLSSPPISYGFESRALAALITFSLFYIFGLISSEKVFKNWSGSWRISVISFIRLLSFGCLVFLIGGIFIQYYLFGIYIDTGLVFLIISFLYRPSIRKSALVVMVFTFFLVLFVSVGDLRMAEAVSGFVFLFMSITTIRVFLCLFSER